MSLLWAEVPNRLVRVRPPTPGLESHVHFSASRSRNGSAENHPYAKFQVPFNGNPDGRKVTVPGAGISIRSPDGPAPAVSAIACGYREGQPPGARGARRSWIRWIVK